MQPKIPIPFSSTDYALELVGLLFLVVLIALPARYMGELPDLIPTHFNAQGTPDDYGKKITIWLLPIVGVLLYALLTTINRFPHIFNYPVVITPDNAAKQYQNATLLIRLLKVVLLAVFTYLTYHTIRTALGKSDGLTHYFLPFILITIFGIIVSYFIIATKK